MKEFLLYLVKILVLSYGAAFFVENMADSGLRKVEGSIYQDWEQILEGKVNAELLISGSSRGAVSYDPAIFEKYTGFQSFNISFNAGASNLQEIKLKSYLQKNAPPKIFVQNIDLAHFGISKAVPSQYQFLPFTNDKYLINNLQKVDDDLGANNFIPLFKYNNYPNFLLPGLLSFFGKEVILHSTKKGYTPSKKSFSRDSSNLERLKNESFDSTSYKRYREGITTTLNILEELSRTTEIFLVWAPEYDERLKIVSNISNIIKNELRDSISLMPNVHLLDFSQDPISEYQSYFYDTFHLNEKGATVFSEKVSREIIDLLDN